MTYFSLLFSLHMFNKFTLRILVSFFVFGQTFVKYLDKPSLDTNVCSVLRVLVLQFDGGARSLVISSGVCFSCHLLFIPSSALQHLHQRGARNWKRGGALLEDR